MTQQSEFLQHLHAEKLRTQEARTKYTLQKLTYATTLLGLGSLNVQLGQFDVSLLLYLVPWVALVFDFYILGEDYSVKRFGAFLRAISTDPLEQQWERWVSKNRDPFALLAMPVLTTLLLLGSTMVILISKGTAVLRQPAFWAWLVVSGPPSWIVFVYYRSLRGRVQTSVQQIATGIPGPVKPLRRLIEAVAAADCQLDAAVYRQARRLFLDCASDPTTFQNLRELAPEYGQSEFLLCVDREGKPVHPGTGAVSDFRATAQAHPDFGSWFREARLPDGGAPVLLVARWLCHLVGLRHQTVHLFIDHPTLAGHTLVQVRGVNRAEAPGCFDLPAAGHVVGFEGLEEALFKELHQELGLDGGDLHGLRSLGTYAYDPPPDPSGLRNAEHRAVFRAQLDAARWPGLSLPSDGVAAIAAFSLAELEGLIDGFPDRVASGLRGSFRLYLEEGGEESASSGSASPA